MRFDRDYIENMLDGETETAVGKVIILSLAEAVEDLEAQLRELAGPNWREHWDAGTGNPLSVD